MVIVPMYYRSLPVVGIQREKMKFIGSEYSLNGRVNKTSDTPSTQKE